MTFADFIDCFLQLNPHPTQLQAKWLAMSLGMEDSAARTVLGKARVCALTDSERILINDYDPELVKVDKLLINDGDDRGIEDTTIDDDGELETPSLDEFDSQREYKDAGN